VEIVTYCDELQVNKANRTVVNKADRTEVEVVPHCDELQVDKANKTEVEVVTQTTSTSVLSALFTCSSSQ
jgi:hypothetical protein